jgi:hypothetical protein
MMTISDYLAHGLVFAVSMACGTAAMHPAHGNPIGYGTSGAVSFSLSLNPDTTVNPDVFILGTAPGGTAGFYSAGGVQQVNTDGTVGQLTFAGGSLADPAGLYTGINSHSGGPTAPFDISGNSVPGLYAATGVGGTWTIQSFANGVAQNENYLSFLWGSVDALNSIVLSENGIPVATLTGAQIQAVATAAGSNGIAGTKSFYVSIMTSGVAFNQITATTGNNYFEATGFSELYYQLPEPGTAPIFAAGLAGLTVIRRQRRQHPSSHFNQPKIGGVS